MHPTIQKASTSWPRAIMRRSPKSSLKMWNSGRPPIGPPGPGATQWPPCWAMWGKCSKGFTIYRRVMDPTPTGRSSFTARLGILMRWGVDLIILNEDGLIKGFEVVMRPYKTIGALRDAMMTRVMKDPRFLHCKSALS